MNESLYQRLGGYDAIAAVADDLLPRLMGDELLARFWQNRPEDSIRREKQLLIDFLCHNAGGPMYYVGRDMATSHRGMGITNDDWAAFIGHVQATLEKFELADREKGDVLGFIESLKAEMVDP
ncbi:MAG: group 1 truncated hemoglobin [Planctomycetaceae bacterium]|nr:group 1 truncated hemoglobin [Planctomycetaceae bacterium]